MTRSSPKGQVEETLRAREEHYKALTAATAQLVWTTNLRRRAHRGCSFVDDLHRTRRG